MLEEIYLKNADDDVKIAFAKIQRNVKKMGQLIDDLLAFARLGRNAIPKRPVDMESLLRRVLREVGSQNSHKTNFDVRTLHPSYGDPALLTQVWVNLISNAIKYSRNRPDPVVEIGSLKNEDETIFYVKDNGVGFELKYVEKLFGVFQRLHAEAEFEGTGIGLAIIKRIISKHGGKVWAEGEINKGATFYFSLPNRI
jgi:light-regulated signal transduction histidine kinase (bacteriophytochrome)